MGKKYTILIWIAAFFWGCIGLFTICFAEVGFTTTELCLLRTLITTICLIPYFLIRNPKVLKLQRFSDIKYFIGTGIFSFAFFNWCYLETIQETSLGVAAILLYTAPAIVMIFSVFLFKESFTKRKIMILFATFIGCVLVTGINPGGAGISFKGMILGLGSGIGYALYSIFGKYALEKYSSMTIVVYTFLFSSIPFLFMVSPLDLVKKMNATGYWEFGMVFALVSVIIPYMSYTKALSYVKASKASLIATLEPVVAALIGIFVLSESAQFSKIVGMILVVGAVCLMSMEEKRGNNEE